MIASVQTGRLRAAAAAVAVAAAPLAPASGYSVTITPAPRSLYLQIGNGTYIGGNNTTGGLPANNATVNIVSASVPAVQVGNGTPVAMTSNSTASNSFIDGFALCNVPAQVYVGGWARTLNGSGTATLTIATPPALTSGPDTIPFNQISWVSSGNGDTTLAIPSGTFAGGTQTLTTIAANTWKEECFAFQYANVMVPPAGTYTGRAVFTLSLP